MKITFGELSKELEKDFCIWDFLTFGARTVALEKESKKFLELAKSGTYVYDDMYSDGTRKGKK